MDLPSLLASEISRDGGCSFATMLLDYDPRIKKLLCATRLKLLTYAERQSSVFVVDRGPARHRLALRAGWESYVQVQFPPTNAAAPPGFELKLKLIALLQKRAEKLVARALLREKPLESTDSNELPICKETPLFWLVKRLPALILHKFLRALDFYAQSNPLTATDIGSAPWCTAAAPFVLPFVESQTGTFVVTRNDFGEPHALVALHPSCVHQPLPGLCVPRRNKIADRLAADTEGAFSVTAARAAGIMAKDIKRCYIEYLEYLDYCCRRTGPTSSPEIMSRCVDMAAVVTTAASTVPAAAPAAYATNPRCVDMTAGVGGLSLALAKVFTVVEAFEIDPGRCTLLRANCESKGFGADQIKCVCGDSLLALTDGDVSSMPPLPASVLDPPWGGVAYNAKDAIAFAGRPLHSVVATLLGRVSVLGLKLPLKYDVASLVRLVDEATSGAVRCRTMKKVWRQFFVVFSLFPEGEPTTHKY